jgi:hypothetical protein
VNVVSGRFWSNEEGFGRSGIYFMLNVTVIERFDSCHAMNKHAESTGPCFSAIPTESNAPLQTKRKRSNEGTLKKDYKMLWRVRVDPPPLISLGNAVEWNLVE